MSETGCQLTTNFGTRFAVLKEKGGEIMENLESLKEIDRAADRGWAIADLKKDYELKDRFEHIRFHIQKIKDDNGLDFIWRPKK